ncbi:MAG TPA: hypothetical protein VH227_07220 [Candidatus Udaeobacter sp.]|jgi:hypothetical protein|nr:hypothetical protein [Candidatus Udaeobacter sp.]
MSRLPQLLVVLITFLVIAFAPAQRKLKPFTPACGTWDLVSSPSPNGSASLTAVANVPGTAELWSVGLYNGDFHWLTLIEHWDGTSWRVIASPNHPSANHYLYAGHLCRC